jgi:hypothetical protein
MPISLLAHVLAIVALVVVPLLFAGNQLPETKVTNILVMAPALPQPSPFSFCWETFPRSILTRPFNRIPISVTDTKAGDGAVRSFGFRLFGFFQNRHDGF